MNLTENVPMNEEVAAGLVARTNLAETVGFGRAKLHLVHRRPTRFITLAESEAALIKGNKLLHEKFLAQGGSEDTLGLMTMPDPTSYEDIGSEEVWNQITNAGRDFLHSQGYNTTGIGTNGLNYIALTNTAITPAAGDTTLSGEITTNGLGRTQGAYAHTAGTNTTTITNTFTCATASQAAQAAALFTASSSGTMNHELTFTQRTLQVGDQLVVTYTITLG